MASAGVAPLAEDSFSEKIKKYLENSRSFLWPGVGECYALLTVPAQQKNNDKPGFGLPVQLILDQHASGGYIHLLRAILGEDEKKMEFDVLSISDQYDPRVYLHPSTIFWKNLPRNPREIFYALILV